MFWTLTDFRAWWHSPARFRWTRVVCAPDHWTLPVGARHAVPMRTIRGLEPASKRRIIRARRGREFTAPIAPHRDLTKFGDLL
ncbi:MAG: hypothetical protein ACRD5M_02845 [Candidatus Acidiferrales bacterium]